MTAIDDIAEGDWVAVHTYAHDEQTEGSYFGTPLKVKRMSLPWLAVEEPSGLILTFDIRHVGFQKLDKRYATFVSKAIQDGKFALMADDEEDEPPTDAVADNRCPRCGEPLIQRSKGEGIWVPACRECDYEGPEPWQSNP